MRFERLARLLSIADELGAAGVVSVPVRPPAMFSTDVHLDDMAAAVYGEWAALLGEGTSAVFLEPLNRYEATYMRRVEQAANLARQIGSPRVRALADLFHMNIEENDVHGALRSVAGHLKHVHLADNNRTAPGMGHLDLGRFLETLFGIGYRGAIAMECDVQALDRYGRNAFTSDPEVFDRYAVTAISNLKRMEAGLQTKVAV